MNDRKQMNKLKKGFTLVELMVSIMLTSMVLLIVGVIFNTMFTSRKLIQQEASIQADMRTSMQYVDRTISKSTAIFILDDSKYGNKSKFTKGWSYVGLSEDGKKILNYIWDKANNDWIIRELGTKSLYDLKMELDFKKNDDYKDNRLVSYELKGKYAGSQNQLSIHTAMSALNTKQVFSKVAKGKRGIALAYRDDPIEGQANVAISFVFDASGSMNFSLDGTRKVETWSRNPLKNRSRIEILREKSKNMMAELQSVGNVSVNLVQFNSHASFVQQNFLELDKGLTSINSAIDNLNPEHATNPGDGLRYGMVSLQNNAAQLKYVVLLTDGVPTAYTVDPRYNYRRNKIELRGIDKDGEEFVSRSSFYNWKYDLSTEFHSTRDNAGFAPGTPEPEVSRAIKYSSEVSKKFGKGIKRINVIGFSADKNDKVKGEELTSAIKEGVPETSYTDVSDDKQLEQTFADIKKQVEQDLWFVNGP